MFTESQQDNAAARVGLRVRLRRLRLGIKSQGELGLLAWPELSESAAQAKVSRIERGMPPSVDDYKALARVLHTTPEVLCGIVEEGGEMSVLRIDGATLAEMFPRVRPYLRVLAQGVSLGGRQIVKVATKAISEIVAADEDDGSG